MVMNKNAIFLAIGAAAVLAIVLAPSLAPYASAVRADRETIDCTNQGGGSPGGPGPGPCPGGSSGSTSITETCTPRNRGADADCSGSEATTDPVNPP
jgi:hypothetical protein